MTGRTTFPIPRTLLHASHSLSFRGNPGRSYFAVEQGSSTRLQDRRRLLTCFASMVKPYNRSSSRLRVIHTRSPLVVRLKPFPAPLSALRLIFVCQTTCSTALVWKRSHKNRRHSRPPTSGCADSICFGRAT